MLCCCSLQRARWVTTSIGRLAGVIPYFLQNLFMKPMKEKCILTHFAIALIFSMAPKLPAINSIDWSRACFWRHSWSTAGFSVIELGEQTAHDSSRCFCFRANGNFMDCSFLVPPRGNYENCQERGSCYAVTNSKNADPAGSIHAAMSSD